MLGKSDASFVYLKFSQTALGLVAFFYILYVSEEIVVPIVFATIIAILLNPVVNFLCRFRCNRVLSISIVVVLAILLLAALGYFLFSQATMLGESLPQFKEKFFTLLDNAVDWCSLHFNINKPVLEEWLAKLKTEGINNSSSVIGTTLTSVGSFLIVFLLLPVYVFMILFYKPLLLEFIEQLFKNKRHELVAEVLGQTKSLIQNYLIGLLLEAAIVGALNAGGLLLLGIPYALLIGVIGALLNMIPYIGGIIAIGIPMLMAIATQQPIDALWVLLLYSLVQLIDNNIIVPRIVASKVKINGLFSIIVVLVGGALWGVAGMFLAIPLTAILKVLFDRIDGLKPFGFLLGDTQEAAVGWQSQILSRKSKVKKD